MAEKIELPGNSKYQKEETKKDEPKKLEAVVTGKVVQRKKGIGSTIRENMAGEDARSVGSYIFVDVLIPAVKSMLADAASQGVERLLFGDSRGRAKVSGQSRSGYTSYSRMYSGSSGSPEKRELSNRGRSSHDFDEIILESRGEAEEVIDQLSNLVDDYGHAKLSDLYTLANISKSYVDDKWGWTDLSSASTSRVRGGYLLNLPRPVVLRG